MQIGQLFLWNNFPYPKDNSQKTRLFIFLGKSNIFLPPIVAYIITFTSQTQHYNPSSDREKNTIVKFKEGEFSLDKDSVADLDNDFFDFILESEINTCSDIKIISHVTNEKLKLIYKKLLQTGISKKIKCDIHQCLNSAGVTGLKRP